MKDWLMTPRRIYVHDVAMRDGLQIESQFVATEDKVRMIKALSRTGLHKIEVTSFTSPKAIPALRAAEMVRCKIERLTGVCYAVLVPNMRGAERALECKADELNLIMSASETHNLFTTRMARQQSRRVLADICRLAEGQSAINFSISTVFGCLMEGGADGQCIARFSGWN